MNFARSLYSLLLHAKMKDYATCSAVTNIWLKNPHNFVKPDYHVLLELYIGKVLIPLNKWQDIPAFVDSCPGLEHKAREVYKKQVKTLERRKELAEINQIHQLGPADGATEPVVGYRGKTAPSTAIEATKASNGWLNYLPFTIYI